MASSSFSSLLPPKFTGENYTQWTIMMKAYLRAYDLWEATEKGTEPPPLPKNPSLA